MLRTGAAAGTRWPFSCSCTTGSRNCAASRRDCAGGTSSSAAPRTCRDGIGRGTDGAGKVASRDGNPEKSRQKRGAGMRCGINAAHINAP